jgi:hypothetical protein
MKKSIILLTGLLILLIPTAAGAAPDEYTWSTNPASGSVQDGFCYEGVDPDEDIDCAGEQNWCDDRTEDRACDDADDEWLCDNGDWACDNGERTEPNETQECEPVDIQAEGCYSAFSGEYTCYSDGDRFTSLKPGGCECQNNYECTSGLCRSGACITYVAPTIEFEPALESLQLAVDEQRSVNIRIQNEMERNDTVNLTFSGRAVTENLLEWDITESSGVTCNQDQTNCEVTVESVSSTTISTTFTGAACTTSDCSGDLIISVISSESQLSSDEDIPVRIQAIRDGQTVEAPGLTQLYLLILVLLAGLYTARRQ